MQQEKQLLQQFYQDPFHHQVFLHIILNSSFSEEESDSLTLFELLNLSQSSTGKYSMMTFDY
ncbi:hypothetical protein DERP_013795 [Dermatophagoides pteronyssinus]|uniref:Uncharacterized protein n=1 Tax=Dermatophagoides pteronyssinus TaxID=6956 RepID=A0ABQ8JD50_DERPT|nr:hypothetical protein DERP_013795 [Dermatophagoides pteronyssinus]